MRPLGLDGVEPVWKFSLDAVVNLPVASVVEWFRFRDGVGEERGCSCAVLVGCVPEVEVSTPFCLTKRRPPRHIVSRDSSDLR